MLRQLLPVICCDKQPLLAWEVKGCAPPSSLTLALVCACWGLLLLANMLLTHLVPQLAGHVSHGVLWDDVLFGSVLACLRLASMHTQ
jgi:hypothetical protein